MGIDSKAGEPVEEASAPPMSCGAREREGAAVREHVTRPAVAAPGGAELPLRSLVRPLTPEEIAQDSVDHRALLSRFLQDMWGSAGPREAGAGGRPPGLEGLPVVEYTPEKLAQEQQRRAWRRGSSAARPEGAAGRPSRPPAGDPAPAEGARGSNSALLGA